MRVMRMYARRVGILVLGGFAITLMLVSLPQHTPSDAPAPSARRKPYRKEPLNRRHEEHKLGPPLDLEPPFRGEVDHFSLRKLKKKSESEDEGKRWWPQIPVNDAEPLRDEDIPGPREPSKQDPSILDLRKHLVKWRGRDIEACPPKMNTSISRMYREKFHKPYPVEDNWDRFYAGIGSCEIYKEADYDKNIRDLIHDLRTLPVKHAAIMEGGTQVKLVLDFEGGKQAALKPMRFSREYETDPNHFYFSDFERHNAEIAAFHLDRVLGLRHAIPTTGRVFNLSSELMSKAEHALNKTFFTSPFHNLCFVSRCDYYCDTTHAICGKPHMKEASVQVFLPEEDEAPRDHARSPYRRTYSKRRQVAEWQSDPSYCDVKVKKKKTFAHGTKLVDLAEMSVFDFLTGNQDRHHFEGFDIFEQRSGYPIFFDNGRAFGRPMWDDKDILAPLAQCCLIRPKFLRRLLDLYEGPKSLAQVLHESMSSEPVSPVLAQKHYPALERRLKYVLETVRDCVRRSGDADSVILNEYHNADVDPDDPLAYPDEEETERPKRRRKHRRKSPDPDPDTVVDNPA